MGQFTLTTEFSGSAKRLRELLGTPGMFEEINDPDMEFELVAAPREVTEGEEITFAIVTGGIRQILRHRWTTVNELLIVAEQVEGPTQSWHHTQRIAATSGGCSLTDSITFEPPGGVLGFMVTEDAIAASLEQSTGVRHRLIAQYLDAQPA